MLRDRVLKPRGFLYVVVAWGVVLGASPRLAEAAPIPPVPSAGVRADLDATHALLEQKVVRARLTALGVAPAEAEAVLARLAPAERAELAARADELAAGGDGAIFLVALVVGLLVILLLELMGRRVVSRP